jgi:hypothetical protein
MHVPNSAVQICGKKNEIPKQNAEHDMKTKLPQTVPDYIYMALVASKQIGPLH